MAFMARHWQFAFHEVAYLQVTAEVFWMYFAGATISLTGAIMARKEVLVASGTDRLLSLAPLFYALPLAVFGAQHFNEAKNIAGMVPSWMPARLFWAYFVGTALIAAAISLVMKKYTRLSGTLLGVMFFLFVVMIHIPNVIAEPRNRFMWALAFRDLSFCGGALGFAGTQTEEWTLKRTSVLITFGRIFITMTALFFGVEQLLHPGNVPAVPLEKQTPEWVPGHIAWGYVGGVVSLAAGVGLMRIRTARLAAISLGVMVLAVMVFVYLPILIGWLTNIGEGLDYFADTLLYAGAVLMLAGALPKGAEHPQ